jgi:hypothetical protein
MKGSHDMRNRTNTLLILLALAFGVFLVANQYVIAKPSPDEGKRKWEYCHVFSASSQETNKWKASVLTSATTAGRFDEIDTSADGLVGLNKLGAEGWELVAIIQNSSGSPDYILKRPKP